MLQKITTLILIILALILTAFAEESVDLKTNVGETTVIYKVTENDVGEAVETVLHAGCPHARKETKEAAATECNHANANKTETGKEHNCAHAATNTDGVREHNCHRTKLETHKCAHAASTDPGTHECNHAKFTGAGEGTHTCTRAKNNAENEEHECPHSAKTSASTKSDREHPCKNTN